MTVQLRAVIGAESEIPVAQYSTTIHIGKARRVAAEAVDDDQQPAPIDGTIDWTSDQPNVATIENAPGAQDGRQMIIRGKRGGVANILGSAMSFGTPVTTSIAVTVPSAATGITVTIGAEE